MWSLRKTRSGQEFSPFPGFLGDVLACEANIETALRAAVATKDEIFEAARYSVGPELSDLTDYDYDENQDEDEDGCNASDKQDTHDLFVPTGFAHLARHLTPTTATATNASALSEAQENAPRHGTKRSHSSSPPSASVALQLVQGSHSSPSPFPSQSLSQSPSTASSSRKKRRQAHSRSSRAAKVAESKDKYGISSLKTRRTVVGRSEALETNLDTDNLPCASGGYTSKPDHFYGRKKAQSVEQLEALGFSLFEWNGFDTIPVLDSQQRVCAVLEGQPRDASYAQAAQDSYDLIKEGRDNERWEKADKKHKRHKKPAAMYGISYGKGQKVPARLSKKTHAALLDRLVASQPIRRIAGFQSAGFALWAPRTYAYYRHRLSLLYGQLSTLHPNFPMSLSIFPCCSFNFGPRNWCWTHKDTNNCPFGWCGITAFGPFDPKKGGHLVLWDLGLIIEFPPGSTILIPSAVIAHSNIPVQDHEDRVSFTQYCAGGLFRWVDNGFRTDDELLQQDAEKWEEMVRLKKTRWQMGLGLFSTIDELLSGMY